MRQEFRKFPVLSLINREIMWDALAWDCVHHQSNFPKPPPSLLPPWNPGILRVLAVILQNPLNRDYLSGRNIPVSA